MAVQLSAVDTIKLKWKTCPKAPAGMIWSSAASSDGSKVYFAGWNNVYEYNIREYCWSDLPHCPRTHPDLVVVEGLPTALVGGANGLGPTNDLFSLTHEKGEQPWTKHYPPMTTKRMHSAVVSSGSSLIVAGGHGVDGTAVAVEMMDTSSRNWFTASSLPHYFGDVSAKLCGDSLYLMGGHDKYGTNDSSLSVLTCSLTALLESCRSQSLPASVNSKALSTTERPQVWKKAADASVYFTSCTTLCGRVIAVSGNRKTSHDRDPTNNVYQYVRSNQERLDCYHMPTPRYQCLIAALPDNSILVVGGQDQGSFSDIIQVGSVVNELID